MAQKETRHCPCNLLKLREKFNLTQKELGKILGVSERTICNYETDAETFPVYRAVDICKRFNCTLDWMYCFSGNVEPEAAFSDIIERRKKFTVDIRDFLSFSNDSVAFTIPNYYLEYIKKRNEITSSKIPDGEKERKIAELDGVYKIREKEQEYWQISINAKDFISLLRFDSKFVPFADNSDSDANEPSNGQSEEATAFLKFLSDINDDI